MKSRNSSKDIETILSGIAYPGDDETELEYQVSRAGIPDKVMREIRLDEGLAADAPLFGKNSSRWAGMMVFNIILILLFAGWPVIITEAVGTSGYYTQTLFLVLGLTTSVSIIGFILSIDYLPEIRLLPAFLSRRS